MPGRRTPRDGEILVTQGAELTIVILAYNEEAYIRKAARTISNIARSEGIDFNMVLVNDGSTDRTGAICAEIVSELADVPVTVLNNETNMGIGASFRRALAQTTSEYITWFPGDDDVSPDLVRDMLRAMKHADVTFTYFLNREIRGRMRNFISMLYCMAFMTVFETFILYFNGPAVYRTRCVKDLPLHGTRFGFIAELHVKLLRSNVTYLELPGYMLTGVEQSTAISWRNLREAIATFFGLFLDVHWRHRDLFSRRPSRVHLTRDFEVLDHGGKALNVAR